MARPCPVCIHDSRMAIEQAILNGKSASQVARQFGFMYESKTGPKPNHKQITNHRDNHMPEAYQASVKDREAASGNAMAARLRYLDEQVDTVIGRAAKGEVIMVGDVPLLDDDGRPVLRYNDRLLLAAIREARGNVELTAKLAGAIPEGKSEELDRMRDLLKSPEARKLLAKLDALDAQEDAATSRSGD